MKKIILFSIVSMVVMACGKSERASEFAFLDNLGVDIDSVKIIKDKIDIDINSPFYHLTEEQATALFIGIDPDATEDEETMGTKNNNLVALKKFDNGIIGAFLWQEFGDGGTMYFCTYNSNGKFCDGFNIGPWSISSSNISDDGAATLAEEDKTDGTFSGNTMTLHRNHGGMEIDNNMPAGNEKEGKGFQPQWTIDKTYTYDINDNGRITLSNVELKKTGSIPTETLLIDDIGDFARTPVSDVAIFGKMDELAKKIMGGYDENSNVANQMVQQTWDSFVHQAPSMLLFLSNKKEKAKALQDCLKKCVLYGYIQKEELDSKIDAISDQGAKEYLSNLTADWKGEELEDDDFSGAGDDFDPSIVGNMEVPVDGAEQVDEETTEEGME